jgi:hypothetical protein
MEVIAVIDLYKWVNGTQWVKCMGCASAEQVDAYIRRCLEFLDKTIE